MGTTKLKEPPRPSLPRPKAKVSPERTPAKRWLRSSKRAAWAPTIKISATSPRISINMKKGKKDKKGKKAKKGKKGGKGKGKGGDEGMEGPEGPEDMPPMGPPPSCAERAFEGLWMATDADGNDNLDAAEFGAVVDYGCAEDSECTPEDAEMAKGWFDEVTGGEPVPKDEVKDFMWEMGA